MTTTPSPSVSFAEERRRVSLRGGETAASLATLFFKDGRVAALLTDLNAPLRGRAAEPGLVVVIPGKREAQAFAVRMGFSLGYDPSKAGGTAAKRKWKKHSSSTGSAIKTSPADLARLFASQGVDADSAAKRIILLDSDDSVRAFASESFDDDDVNEIARAVQTRLARVEVRAKLRRLADAVLATATPDGRRVLLEGIVRDPARVGAVLSDCLVPDADRAALSRVASSTCEFIRTAEQLADQDVHVRDAHLSLITDDARRSVLTALVNAIVDGAPILSNERVELLGVAPVLNGIEAHLTRLGDVLKKLADSVDEAPATVIDALDGRGDPRALARPWPVGAALLARFRSRLAGVHAGQVDRGVVALAIDGIAPSTTGETTSPGKPNLTLAELQARAAANARLTEAHDDVPARLAQTVVSMFDPLRPSTADTGPAPIMRQRRQSRFEKAILLTRHGDVDAAVSVALVDELLHLASGHADSKISRCAARLSPDARRGALALAKKARFPIPVLLRNASEVGRALMIVAIALDPELGPALSRSSGQEAALSTIRHHASRTLALATQTYAKAD